MSAVSLFVVNPISGDNDKSSIIKKINSWAQSSGECAEIWQTTGKNDEDVLKQKIQALKPEKIVAVGGDGTVLLCATALIHSNIPLGILPLGSANGMCAELGIPLNINEALEILERGKTKTSDMLKFDEKHLAIHISDIGLNAGLVKQFEQNQRRGFLGYAKGLIGELTDLKPFSVSIKTDREDLDSEAYMLAFGNARRYGTGAVLNKVGKIDDGLMELSVLSNFDITAIAGHFFEIINDESQHMKTIQCRKATIQTNRVVPFQIDGESQPDTQQITVEVIPSCIRFIVP